MLINSLGNVYNVCVVPENIHTSPEKGNIYSEGRRVQNVAISRGGCLQRVFFTGGKIGELLINGSFLVEQAFSYFTITGV